MDGSAFEVVIADRNPHVRDFLRREFIREGYRVRVLRDGPAICQAVAAANAPDLVVLDWELPYMGGVGLLERLYRERPDLPIVLQAFSTDELNHPAVGRAAALVEKSADTDRLKRAVREVLRRRYPNRFSPEPAESA